MAAKSWNSLSALVLAAAVLQAGCSGAPNDAELESNFQGTGSTPGARTTLSGLASRGPISGGSVLVVSVNADGSNGLSLGTSTVNADGSFSVSIPSGASGPVRVLVQGGSYTSEFDGSAQKSNQILSAVVDGVGSLPAALPVNPVTSFVDVFSSAMASKGAPFTSAHASANTAIMSAYGFGASTTAESVLPDFSAASSGNSATLLTVLGGLESEASTLGVSDRGTLVTALSQDVSDGVFDGQSGGTPIPFNGGTLPAAAGTTLFTAGVQSFAAAQSANIPALATAAPLVTKALLASSLTPANSAVAFALFSTQTPPGPDNENPSTWGGILHLDLSGDGATFQNATGVPATSLEDPSALVYRAASSEVFVSDRHGNNGADGVPGSITRFAYNATTRIFTRESEITGNNLNGVHQANFSPTTGELFAANDGGGISRFTFGADGTATANGVLGTGTMRGVIVTPDGAHVISTSADDTIHSFDLTTGAELPSVTNPNATGNNFHYLTFQNGELYVAALGAGAIDRFTLDASDNLTFKDSIPADSPVSVAFSPDGQEMYTATNGNTNIIDRFTYTNFTDSWTRTAQVSFAQSVGGLLVLPLGNVTTTPVTTNTTTGLAERPIQTEVNATEAQTNRFSYGQDGGGEVGEQIHFLKNGQVTQLGYTSPLVGNFSVSFWAVTPQTLLATTTVQCTDTQNFFYTDISPLNITANTEYVLSYHIVDGTTQPHWIFSDTNLLLPLTLGDLVVDVNLDLATLPDGDTTPTYPGVSYPGEQSGVDAADLTFVPNSSTVIVEGTAAPWTFSNTMNANLTWASTGATPAAVIPGLQAGETVNLTYVSGSLTLASGGSPAPDSNGDPDIQETSSDNLPSEYLPASQQPSEFGALLGVFTDAGGNVIGSPFKVGTQSNWLVPTGATQMQLGVDDTIYSDNAGSYSIQVAITH